MDQEKLSDQKTRDSIGVSPDPPVFVEEELQIFEPPALGTDHTLEDEIQTKSRFGEYKADESWTEEKKSFVQHYPKGRIPFIRQLRKRSSIVSYGIVVGLALCSLVGIQAGAFSFLKSASVPVLGMQHNEAQVLGDATSSENIIFKVNVPATFTQDATFEKDIHVLKNATFSGSLTIQDQNLNLGTGQLTASNVIYGLTAGDGIALVDGQRPTISNTGVLSLGGSTGVLSLTAGTGIGVSGLTITNNDPGSSQNIFKTISINGTNAFTATANTDILNFVAGTGITITNPSGNTLTIASSGVGAGATAWSGITDPTANLSLSMAGFSSTLTYGAATGTANLFTLTDTSSNTGTGYLFNLVTQSGSTLKPFRVVSAGTNALTIDESANTIIGGGFTLSSLTTNGGILFTNGSGVVSQTSAGTGTQCLFGGTTPTWGSCVTGNSYFDQQAGLLSAANTTVDFAIGGVSTESAKFAVLHVSNGIPVASVSAGATGATYLTADGFLQTTAKQSLTLGGGSTGNVVLSGIGTGVLHSVNGVLSSASVNLGGSDVSGTLTVGKGGTGVTTVAGGSILAANALDTLSAITSTSGLKVLQNNAGTVSWVSTTGTGNVVYDTSPTLTTPTLGVATATSLALGTNPAAAGTLRLPSNTYITTRNNANNGDINVIKSDTSDLIAFGANLAAFTLGGTVSGNAQTISGLGTVSFGTNNLSLSGTTISTTGNNSSILLSPNGTGNVGIGTTAPVSLLDVRSTLGTTPAASISGRSNSIASLTVDNWGTGDIFTASASGLARLTLTNAGQLALSAQGLGTGLSLGGDTTLYRSGTTALTSNATTLNFASAALSVSSCSGCGSNYFLQVNGNGVNNGGYTALGNLTTDLFIGGTSTQSAKFAVLNVNNNTPTATIAGNISLGAASGTTRTIGASAMNALQFGDATTGDLLFAPGNNNVLTLKAGGNVGVGTTNPRNPLSVTGTVTDSAVELLQGTATGTGAAASILTIGGTVNLNNTLAAVSGSMLVSTQINVAADAQSQGMRFIPTFTPSVVISNGIYGFQNNYRIGNSSSNVTGAFVGMYSKLKNDTSTAAYSGTISNLYEFQADDSQGFTGGANGTIIGHVGLNVVNLAQATNNTLILLGTTTIPTGNFGMYNASAYQNYIAGNVGIGITSPRAQLDVVGTFGTAPAASISARSNSFAGLVIDNRGTGDIFTASASGLARFVIQNSGNVGIGTTAPSAPLEVKASGTGTIAKFTSNNVTGCALATDGTLACSSDERLKKNITNLSYGLDDVLKLRAVEYNWKTDDDTVMKSLGFIAQEVEPIIPKLVDTDSSTGFKQLNTIGMIPVLTKSIQQLNARIDIIASLSTQSAQIRDLSQDPSFVALFSRQDDQEHRMKTMEETLALVASNSAGLTPSILGATTEDTLDMTNATVSGRLMVLGRTTLSDLGVTGNINAGLMTVEGLDGAINTLAGDLKLQNKGLGGVDILAGKVTIDTYGNMNVAETLTVKKVVADEYATSGQSAGTAILPKGNTSMTITSPVAKENSLIFLTPQKSIEQQLAVSGKTTGHFTVSIKAPVLFDIPFDWLIVGKSN